MRNLIRSAVLAALTIAAASAATITFLDPGAYVSNGVSYVGPYDLRITTAVDSYLTQGICISPFIEIAGVWAATEYPIVDFADLPQPFAFNVQRAAWLAEQFTPANLIPVQEAMWTLFGDSYPADPVVAAWVQASLGKTPAGQWDAWVPVVAGASQTVLVRETTSSRVPEPGPWWLTLSGIGFCLAGMTRRFRFRRLPRQFFVQSQHRD